MDLLACGTGSEVETHANSKGKNTDEGQDLSNRISALTPKLNSRAAMLAYLWCVKVFPNVGNARKRPACQRGVAVGSRGTVGKVAGRHGCATG